MNLTSIFSWFFKADTTDSAKTNTVKLSDKIPIWKVEKHLVLSKIQALSTVLELTLPEAYSLSAESLVDTYQLFNRIVKAIPRLVIVEYYCY